MTSGVYFVVPDMIDDPGRVSGGNMYNRRLRDGFVDRGWRVELVRVADGAQALDRALAAIPNAAPVLVDGLLVSHAPRVAVAHAQRLSTMVLVHMVSAAPQRSEVAALRLAARVITTSGWARSVLLEQWGLAPDRVDVAHPGADPAPLTSPSKEGGRLLSVGAVIPRKGLDVLVTALAQITSLPGWHLTVVGSRSADPEFATGVTASIARTGLGGRVSFTGPLEGDSLASAYAGADLLVHPARSESYGMVISDALAHGIPVLACGVDGVRETAAEPSALATVPPEDAAALRDELERWLSGPEHRRAMRAAAMSSRRGRRSWGDAVSVVADACRGVIERGVGAEARVPEVVAEPGSVAWAR